MANFKEKSQVFLLGLMLGLLIAGSFFILKLDDYFKELSVYKSIANTFSPAEKEQPVAQESGEQEVQQVQRKSVPKHLEANVNAAAQKENKSVSNDSSRLTKLADSTLGTSSDDIVVLKDQIQHTTTVDIIAINNNSMRASKDSLAAHVGGVRDDRSGKQMMNIEFWNSPLNYKGYKMSKYKLVLYGITGGDNCKLYKLDDIIYLKDKNSVYRLDYSGDFRSYDQITDNEIISKLK